MANHELAVVVKDLYKSFKLPHEQHSGIKQNVLGIFNRDKGYEVQEVLKGISFDIQKGEFFGIVGRNGSGKSTLLKLLAGIYAPDDGLVKVNGSLTPFIELGVGFNPELTGRENVFLNGSLLGFSHAEMEAMYDSIVEFAELEKFMDQKLKNYSSGMQVRLAFSIAIKAKSDVLILDEVLAVGDEAFQQKCIDVFEKYKADKQTIILVTHSMETVRRFCSKALLLNNGEIVHYGTPEEVADKYSKLNSESTEGGVDRKNDSTEDTAISLVMKNSNGKKTSVFNTGDTMTIEVGWPKKYDNVKHVGVAIVKNSGEFVYGGNTFTQNPKIDSNSIINEISLDIGSGKYHLMAGLFGETKYDVIDFVNIGPEFMIRTDSKDQEHGIARLKSIWR